MPGDPTKVYRYFKAGPNHLMDAEGGGHRLKSSWFRCTHGGVSVDDGAISSAEETWARNVPCGVAAIPKSVIEAEGLSLTFDPQDSKEDLERNPAHRLVADPGSKGCRRITQSAEVVIRLDGWQVRGANGTVGVSPLLKPVDVPFAVDQPKTEVREEKDTLPLFPEAKGKPGL